MNPQHYQGLFPSSEWCGVCYNNPAQQCDLLPSPLPSGPLDTFEATNCSEYEAIFLSFYQTMDLQANTKEPKLSQLTAAGNSLKADSFEKCSLVFAELCAALAFFFFFYYTKCRARLNKTKLLNWAVIPVPNLTTKRPHTTDSATYGPQEKPDHSNLLCKNRLESQSCSNDTHRKESSSSSRSYGPWKNPELPKTLQQDSATNGLREKAELSNLLCKSRLESQSGPNSTHRKESSSSSRSYGPWKNPELPKTMQQDPATNGPFQKADRCSCKSKLELSARPQSYGPWKNPELSKKTCRESCPCSRSRGQLKNPELPKSMHQDKRKEKKSPQRTLKKPLSYREVIPADMEPKRFQCLVESPSVVNIEYSSTTLLRFDLFQESCQRFSSRRAQSTQAWTLFSVQPFHLLLTHSHAKGSNKFAGLKSAPVPSPDFCLKVSEVFAHLKSWSCIQTYQGGVPLSGWAKGEYKRKTVRIKQVLGTYWSSAVHPKAWERAALNGHVGVLEHLLQVATAAHTENQKELYSAEAPSSNACSSIEPFKCPCPAQALEFAIEKGHLDTAKWLYNQIGVIKCRQQSIDFAAQHGHLELLSWVESWHPTQLQLSSSAFDLAAGSGCIATVEWIHSRRSKPTSRAFVLAAQYGHIQMLDWLFKNTPDSIVQDERLWDHAALYGRLEVLEWLMRRKHCFSSYKCFEWAKANGHHHVRVWLRANIILYPKEVCDQLLKDEDVVIFSGNGNELVIYDYFM